MRRQHENILERLAAKAIRQGADFLAIEYKDGYEEVVAGRGAIGYGMARFQSSSREAMALRDGLYRIVNGKLRISVDGAHYELRGRVYESFGEDAFRVRLRRI